MFEQTCTPGNFQNEKGTEYESPAQVRGKSKSTERTGQERAQSGRQCAQRLLSAESVRRLRLFNGRNLCLSGAVQQVVIQTKSSVYNVHVDKKREQEGMKVGNDFGSTSLKPNPSNSVICISPSSVSRCGTFDPE